MPISEKMACLKMGKERLRDWGLFSLQNRKLQRATHKALPKGQNQGLHVGAWQDAMEGWKTMGRNLNMKIRLNEREIFFENNLRTGRQ